MNGRDLCPVCGQPIHPGECEKYFRSGYQKQSANNKENRSSFDKSFELKDIVLVKWRVLNEEREYTGEVIDIHETEFKILVKKENDEIEYNFKMSNDIDVKVLFSSTESTFGEEFQIGSIVKNFSEYYNENLLLGEIVEINEDRNVIKIKWYSHYNDYEEFEETTISYPYNSPEVIPSVIVSSEKALFPYDYEEGKLIGFREKSYFEQNDYYQYEYILEVSKDRRSIKVEYLNYEGACYEISSTFFQYYCDYFYFGDTEIEFLNINRDKLKNEIRQYVSAIEANLDYD